MKTLLFITALLISLVTFSQTLDKTSNVIEPTKENATQQMNKAELIDAIAKETSTSNNNTKKKSAIKSYGSTRSNKQTIRTNQDSSGTAQTPNAVSINENPLYKGKNDAKTNPIYND